MSPEQGSFIDRADRYLRRENTNIARIAHTISPTGHDYLNSRRKRLLVDIPVGLAGGILTAIPAAILCAQVYREDHGPIFYKHERMGKNGKTIFARKIRSMKLNPGNYSVEEIERINLELGPGDDPRNTRIGRLLRRFELDELPQFWQVVKGDFSMCGIRVMNKAFRDSMARSVDPSDMVKWDEAYNRNHGIFNPNASRGRHRKDDKKRIHDDLLYDRKASLGMDYYLLTVTSLRMIEMFNKWRIKNAYAPLKDVDVRGISIKVASSSKREWLFAKHFINELALDKPFVEHLRNSGGNGHLLDIGASIGIYSSLALSCGLDVTAIEPDSDCMLNLHRNMQLNQQREDQAHVISTALSDINGSAELFSDGYLNACPSLRRTLNQEGSRRVPTQTLDELLEAKAIRMPTVIKIDVEGAEMQVLKGGRRYFSSSEAADIFLEIHPAFLPLFGSDSNGVVKLLTEEFGYSQAERMHKQNEVLLHFSKKIARK